MPRRRDVLVEEIRAVRQRISERFNHDTKALVDHYRELESRHPERMLGYRGAGTTQPRKAREA